MRHYNFPAREGVLRPVRGVIRKPATREEISIELWRKSIHVLIGFAPLIMSLSRDLAIAALTLGIFAYTLFEYLRMKGIRVPVISYITAKAARLRDAGKFVVGPITLGAGALLAILLFEPSQASVAIYILALGDGLSSLVGKALGHIRMPFSGGKSLEGTLMCFSVSFLAAVAVSGRPGASLIVAIVSTFVEALPTKDWDNIILPLAAGATAFLLGF